MAGPRALRLSGPLDNGVVRVDHLLVDVRLRARGEEGSVGPPEVIGARHRLAAYRDALAQAFVPLEATPLGGGGGFWARVSDETLSDLHVADVGGSSQVVRRTRRLIAGGAPELVKVGVQLRGAGEVRQDGRLARLAPGDFAVYDTTRPYELTFDGDFEMLVLVCPRQRFLGRVPQLDSLTATTMDAGSGTPALTSSFLRGLQGRPRQPRAATEDGHLSDAAVDLLAATFAGHRSGADLLAAEAATVLASARRYLHAHLSDPALSVGQVAAAHHVSVRYLQKLFEREGTTVRDWVREQRLLACRTDLVDPAHSGHSIADVAAGRGLVDPAQFSRVFRARFGVSPREHRAAAVREG